MEKIHRRFVLTTMVAFILYAALSAVIHANASSAWVDDGVTCPVFSEEQKQVLRITYTIGAQNDPALLNAIGDTIENTTSAIAWREVFNLGTGQVGRVNTADGRFGSFGVMMIQLDTAMDLDRIYNTSYWHRAYLVDDYIITLLTDDVAAVNYGYRYLKQRIIATGSLWRGVYQYNGRGPDATEYMQDIQRRVRTLIRCNVQQEVFKTEPKQKNDTASSLHRHFN